MELELTVECAFQVNIVNQALVEIQNQQ
jgi:hypothetical protein